MPNRVIKESIHTSPNLNALSCEAERHFYRLLLCPDDHGCCECTSRVIKGKCYPLKDDITAKDIDGWQEELESQHIIYRWLNSQRQYAIFPTLSKHQTIRSTHKRKTPEPPKEIIDKCNQLLAYAFNCVQSDSSARLNPNPNPNPNPNKKDNKLSPPDGINTKEVFVRLDKLRGYKPPKRKAEAVSILRMLKIYTPNQIIKAWEVLKQDKFWVDKELFMMTVESQIGAILKNEQSTKTPIKHQTDVKVVR